MMSKYFYIYSDCLPVKGYSRSIVYDLQKRKFIFIPNDLYDITSIFNGKQVSEIYQSYSEKHHSVINSYLDFLNKNDLSYFSKNKLPFPKLDFSFDYPSFFTSSIYYLSNVSKKYFLNTVKYLDELNCKVMQIIVNKEFELKNLKNILFLFWKTNFQTVNIIIDFSSVIDFKYLEKINTIYPFISLLSLFNVPENYNISLSQKFSNISFSTEPNLEKHLFQIREFNVNQELFIEANCTNPYFYRKITIDKNGNIMNTIECDEIFGNIEKIKDTKDLLTIGNNNKFQKYWTTKKDLCDVCKDCEFRYMCIDSRIPIKRNENKYFFKEECNYNPYINKWQGTDGYIPVEVCGKYCEEIGFIPNKDKITILNKQIWGEDE